MPRACGILKVALREDDPGAKLRLVAEDVAGEMVQGKPIEPGLYSCSLEAYQKFAPRVVERLKKTPAIGHDGKPIFADDACTTRTMVLPPAATAENTPPSLLT